MDAYDQLFGLVIESRNQVDRYFGTAQEAIYYRQAYEKAITEGQREPSFSEDRFDLPLDRLAVEE